MGRRDVLNKNDVMSIRRSDAERLRAAEADPIPCEHGNLGPCIECNPGTSLSKVLKPVIEHSDEKSSKRRS